MRVCHVCSAHPVDDVRVFHRECLALAAEGYDVHLIGSSDGMRPYRVNGVTIHPLPAWRNRRERLARRLRVAQMAAELDPVLFHVHEPELLGPVVARAGTRLVVWDVHESYLDVLMERKFLPRWLRPVACLVWDRQEQQLVKRCAAVVSTSEWIAKRYQRMHDRAPVIANYPDLAWVDDLPPVSRDGKTCVFAGALLPNRGLSNVFMALALLKRRGLSVPLELAGRPESETYLRSLWEEVDRLRIRDLVTYHGILPRAEANLLQHRASVGLVPSLPSARNSTVHVPIKMMDFMGLGLPVVFSDFPNYCALAGAAGAGIPVDPTRPEQIANAIERLVRNPELARQMGEAGRIAVRERFNWNRERIKLLEIYREILGFDPHAARPRHAA